MGPGAAPSHAEWPLVAVALPRGVQNYRSHEHHGRIEVQENCDNRVKTEQRGEEHDRPASDPLDTPVDRLEQTIRLDHGADQNQTGRQNERWPRLLGRMKNRLPQPTTVPQHSERLTEAEER